MEDALLVVGVELARREAAAGREARQPVRQPRLQSREVVEHDDPLAVGGTKVGRAQSLRGRSEGEGAAIEKKGYAF